MTEKERMLARQKAIRDRKKATATASEQPKEKKEEKTLSEMKAESKERYSNMLRQYETEATDTTTDSYRKALTTLGISIASSVVKKCVNTSYTEALATIRRSLVGDVHSLSNLEDAMNVNITSLMAFNKDGELVETAESKEANLNLYKLIINNPLSDGMDLVQDAILSILEETQKADTTTPNFLEERRTETQLSKRVYIRKEDSKKGLKEVETFPIRESFRTVRRSIMNHDSLESTSKFTYLDETITDENGDELEVFRRLPKYYDLGSNVCDFNGAVTAYTATADSVNTIETLIEKMNLTTRQAQILDLRLKGYGYKAIATYLGIRADSVRDCMKAIRKKAESMEELKEAIKNTVNDDFVQIHGHFANGKKIALMTESDITADSVKVTAVSYEKAEAKEVRQIPVSNTLDSVTLETMLKADSVKVTAFENMFESRKAHVVNPVHIDRQTANIVYLPAYTNPKAGQTEYATKDYSKQTAEKKADSVTRSISERFENGYIIVTINGDTYTIPYRTK